MTTATAITATEYVRRGGQGVHVDVLYQDAGLEFARFRCRPGTALWAVPNDIGDRDHAVLPGRPVRIHPAGAAPVAADPNSVVRYPARQVYRREPLDRDGDDCLYVAAPDTTLAALAGSATGLGAVPVDPRRVVLVRALARRLAAGVRTSAMAVHETLAVALRPDPSPGDRARRAATRRAHREMVADAAGILATDLEGRLRLADVAARLHVSQYHLARVFRAETGRSMDEYRMRIRVLTAVDRLADGDERIADVAAGLGFSSHGHLTTACRAVLGAPPSQLRRALTDGSVVRARRILEADPGAA